MQLATPDVHTLDLSGLAQEGLSTTFKHSGWKPQRKQVYEALIQAKVSHTRFSAFCSCGDTSFVLRSRDDPSQIRIAGSSCHDRFCRPCASGRSRTIASNVVPYLRKGQCRFVTLTLRHNANGLAHEIDRLYECFKKLRKSTIWAKSQQGGVGFLEIKRSKQGDSWHPHFHILTQGKFMDGAALAAEWKRITTDSFIVDIRFVKDDASVLAYVTKYASKPFDPSLFARQEVLVEAIQALANRRMAVTFGNWKGLQVTMKPDAEAWEKLGTLEEILLKAARGDDYCRALILTACGEKAEMMLRLADRLAQTPTVDPIERPPDQQLYFLEPEDVTARFIAQQ